MINVYFLKNHGDHKTGDQAYIARAVASGLVLGGICECYTDHMDRVAAEAEKEAERERLKPKPPPPKPIPPAAPKPKARRKKRVVKKTNNNSKKRELTNG